MIRCERCKASVAALDWREERLADGTRLQVVKCTLCGWRIDRPAPYLPMKRIAKPNKPKASQHPVSLPEHRPSVSGMKMLPCAVIGCPHEYANVMQARIPLCPVHKQQLKSFNNGDIRIQPLIETDRGWIENPESKARKLCL